MKRKLLIIISIATVLITAYYLWLKPSIKKNIRVVQTYCNSEAKQNSWYRWADGKKKNVVSIEEKFSPKYRSLIHDLDELGVHTDSSVVLDRIGSNTSFRHKNENFEKFTWLLENEIPALSIDITFYDGCLRSIQLLADDKRIGYFKMTSFTTTPPNN